MVHGGLSDTATVDNLLQHVQRSWECAIVAVRTPDQLEDVAKREATCRGERTRWVVSVPAACAAVCPAAFDVLLANRNITTVLTVPACTVSGHRYGPSSEIAVVLLPSVLVHGVESRAYLETTSRVYRFSRTPELCGRFLRVLPHGACICWKVGAPGEPSFAKFVEYDVLGALPEDATPGAPPPPPPRLGPAWSGAWCAHSAVQDEANRLFWWNGRDGGSLCGIPASFPPNAPILGAVCCSPHVPVQSLVQGGSADSDVAFGHLEVNPEGTLLSVEVEGGRERVEAIFRDMPAATTASAHFLFPPGAVFPFVLEINACRTQRPRGDRGERRWDSSVFADDSSRSRAMALGIPCSVWRPQVPVGDLNTPFIPPAPVVLPPFPATAVVRVESNTPPPAHHLHAEDEEHAEVPAEEVPDTPPPISPPPLP